MLLIRTTSFANGERMDAVREIAPHHAVVSAFTNIHPRDSRHDHFQLSIVGVCVKEAFEELLPLSCRI